LKEALFKTYVPTYERLTGLPRIYETLRKVRKVKTAGGDSYEYIVNIPREWVEAVAKELKISLHEVEKEVALYLRIRYNGKLEAEPEVSEEQVKSKI
jgi:hypothetical protein